jgi:Na+-transporting NADH:ubiquinone oxidoreductase subunit F
MSFLIPILIASAVIGGLSVVLVILIMIADAKLADYGECTITINGEKKVVVDGGASLLASLISKDIFIPSACGGRGSCGLCTLKVLDGGGPVLPTEEPHLTPEQIKDNIRLSCQIKIRNDISIEIPSELFSIRRFTGICEKLEDLTHDTKLVTIKLNNPASIDFKAGQYVQLEAPAYGDNPDPVYRAYSMASSPSRHDSIDLIVRLVPGGICTTWVHTILKEGDEVLLNGPYGDFHLTDTKREMIFIAGGSGMAPLRSILYDMAERAIKRPGCYYFGALSKKDLFMSDEIKLFEEKLEDFHYIPALSRPEETDNWDGRTGLITDVVTECEGDMSEKEAYLCGSPGMIDACIKVLTAGGVQEDRIYYDKFA